ncbi:DNA primase [Weeksellaceae bacterium A-14]
MIPKETIDKIFSVARIEEIIGEYVQLKRAGSNLKGLSPFQDEKSPSFIVSPSKQIWKDFSSGKGGTVISFLMELEGFTYPEALRHLAKKYGIEVEETHRELTDEEKKQQTERELLYKIHEVANNYFQDQLWDSEEGRLVGQAYFRERELKEDIIRKFQLGYSPEKKNAFTGYALEKGYAKEILEKSGLSIFPENAPQGIDRFRERVIFPIHSFSGRVLGFGARILKSNVKTAKYLNSPETEIYHKSSVLYGLNQGKQAISRKNICLLVEGYMDVISLHQSGIENVVASSGTSLTTEQIRLIKRLTENVTILFDGDKAGIKASFRSIDMLLSEGMNIRVLLFPDGDDPDSFARKHPQEYVENFIAEQARDFIDFKADILLRDAADDPIRKAEAIRDIVKSVAFVDNVLKREIYLKEVAAKFGLSEQSLFNELNVQQQIVQGNQSAEKTRQEHQHVNTKLEVVQDKTSFSAEPLWELEEKLVELMLKYGDYIISRKDADNQPYEITVVEEIAAYLQEDGYEMLSPVNRKILDEIILGLNQSELRTEHFFVTFLDEEIASKLADNIQKNELQNWASRNIYPLKLGDRISQEVEDDICIHKSHYIEFLISRLRKELDEYRDTDEEKYFSTILQIQKLEKIFRDINAKVNRILTKSHYYYR